MKIAVYTICKNEEQFFKRWLESCKDADHILVVDTGSTDDTPIKLSAAMEEHNNFHYLINTVVPWRFDLPRNYSLMSIPADIDICVCLDMDEVLVEGWRQIIEAQWEQNTDRLRYKYIWSWNEDGTEGVTYHADKIHKRHGFKWKHPVHEVLVKDSRLGPETQKFIQETLIEHHPDDTKSRGQYLDLLELAVKEDYYDDRNAHYYARELLLANRYEDAIREFKRHLSLPTAVWKPERAASMRYMGDCYWTLGERAAAIACFDEAIIEAPDQREGYLSIAQAFRFLKDWETVIYYCEKLLAIVDKPSSYINSAVAWSDWPNQMLKEAKENVEKEN
jgi:tetratricopeptide (TPR) repeat protein